MNHRPRKRFGQNFLHERHYIERIVSAINPQPDQRIVEIGPGEGAITSEILKRIDRMDAIELDRDLCARLREQFAGKLHLHEGDALKFDFSTLASDQPLRVIGNLPYNISSPLLFHLLGYADRIQDMHFMLQKEVVERCCAPPGSRTYGRLSVMLQYHCATSFLFEVPPGAFRPPPKVYSAVMCLQPRKSVNDPDHFSSMEHIVRDAFAARRKTLRNTLSKWFSAEQLQAAGIDPGARAENLAPADYAHLATLARNQCKRQQGQRNE